MKVQNPVLASMVVLCCVGCAGMEGGNAQTRRMMAGSSPSTAMAS